MPGPAPTAKRKLVSHRANERPDDLELSPGVPDMPDELTGEAAREWTRVVKALAPRGVLTDVDYAALTVYAELWGEDREIGRVLSELEVGTTTWRRVMSTRNDIRAKLLAMFARFGLTPADRPRVKLPAGDHDGDRGRGDKSRFFGGGFALTG